MHARRLRVATGEAVPGLPPASEGPDRILDADTVLAGCGGDAALFNRMVQSFRTHVGARLADVREAIRRDDVAALRKAAHKLKGLVSAFSSRGADAVALLEQTDAEGQMDCAGEHYKTIAEMIGSIQRSLENTSINDLKRRATLEP